MQEHFDVLDNVRMAANRESMAPLLNGDGGPTHTLELYHNRLLASLVPARDYVSVVPHAKHLHAAQVIHPAQHVRRGGLRDALREVNAVLEFLLHLPFQTLQIPRFRMELGLGRAQLQRTRLMFTAELADL